MKNKINEKRVRLISKGIAKKTTTLYWMNREQRIQDNWALLFAQDIAIKNRSALIVVFNIAPDVINSTTRQFGFILKGLRQIENELQKFNIPFYVLVGNPQKTIVDFILSYNIGTVVTDFSPLRSNQQDKSAVAKNISIPMYEVDAHNIVPCWITSPKLEFAAYTFRPKIHSHLLEFLDEFPSLRLHSFLNGETFPKNNWKAITSRLTIDTEIKEVDWVQSGEKYAHKMFECFLEERLENYNEHRNNPTIDGQSNLSPYLHFGQISAQRIALEVQHFSEKSISSEAFLEELIVRKELSDNFCFYNSVYDSFDGFPEWAKQTLNSHRNDIREYTYSIEEFENAKTHDALWNAAQLEMMQRGKMHGYMRMYWAKKILEWTIAPEEALRIAIYLNDKYELDGNDPNGYVGIAWSIGGVHDRAWGERNVFGKIRYMSFDGCKRKFDIQSYINSHKK